MSMELVLSEIRNLDGVLELAPGPGSGHPEISWGDHFFYFAPDGRVPKNRQPYATVVTKDYPGDAASRLDDPGRWRLNIHVGTRAAAELVGNDRDGSGVDHSVDDVLLPHPVYGAYGWVCVVNPAGSTLDRAVRLLRDAHRADQRRVERRRAGRPATGE